MRCSLLLLSLAASAFAVAVPRPVNVPRAAQDVPLPSQDAFYVEPANISSYRPGDVVRSRDVSDHISGLSVGPGFESVERSVQYMYRTTDSLARPVAAVATLLIPHNADPDRLVAFEQAYDSADNDCSPSYALRAGAKTTLKTEIIFIVAALNSGNYVVTSDYEGLQAQYVAGKMAGYATLDSVRAVLNDAAATGLSTKARKVMWGYSGGALAAEWAAELQPAYAPDLAFDGAALGGLTPNVSNVLRAVNGGPASALAFAGIRGLAAAYAGPNAVGDLQAYLDAHLIPAKRDEFYALADSCVADNITDSSNKDLGAYLDDGLEALNGPVPAAVFADGGQMGQNGTPSMPLFVYKAIHDEVSPSPDTDALIDGLCAKGATIEYHRDEIGGHVDEAISGSGSALAWLLERLDGKPVANAGRCVTQNVTVSSVDRPTIQALDDEVFAALQAALLGGPVGFDSSS